MKRIRTSRLAMWLRRSAIIGTAVCAGVTLQGSSFAGEPAAPAMAERKIRIANHKYDRPTLTIPAGTTVTWINKDEHLHSVVSRSQAFGSPALKTDETYSYRFTRLGEYEYFCNIHPLMVGTVVVT